jgi:phage-related protein
MRNADGAKWFRILRHRRRSDGDFVVDAEHRQALAPEIRELRATPR